MNGEKLVLEKFTNGQQNMEFTNVFCHTNFLLHIGKLHMSGTEIRKASSELFFIILFKILVICLNHTCSKTLYLSKSNTFSRTTECPIRVYQSVFSNPFKSYWFLLFLLTKCQHNDKIAIIYDSNSSKLVRTWVTSSHTFAHDIKANQQK